MVVVVLEMGEFNLTQLSVKDGKVEYLDDNMGYSEVSQLTDLIEMSH